MMKNIVLWGVVIVVLFGTACRRESDTSGGGRSAVTSPGVERGSRMMLSDFTLVSARDGSMVRSDSFRGQVLLVVFFATWCPPCIQEIPSLVELQEDYGDRGFSVVGMSMDEDGAAPVRRLMEKYGINYPVLMADDRIVRSFGGISGVPVAFLVNRKGEVVHRYLGYVKHRILEDKVRELIESG